MLKKKFLYFLILFFIIFFIPHKTYAADNLVTTPNSSAVYYIDQNNIRHTFPNLITYQSWLGNDFSAVQKVSLEYLAQFPLGKNITLRSGKYLVKVPSLPEVYALEPGGTLRHILNEEVAQQIYGSEWIKKVIDLPEVFFSDYVVGQPIKNSSDLPDGAVYQLNNNYYYKTVGHVKKFNSLNDVLINGYNLQNITQTDKSLFLHDKEIKGYDSSLHNLVQQNNLPKYDCENKNLNGAFIFVYNEKYSPQELEKINNIKNQFPDYFSWATDELSNIKLTTEIFKIKKQDYHLAENELSLQQVGYDFYDVHQDKYDFLFIFDNFSSASKTIAKYNYVTNWIKGNNKSLIKAESQYGSLGKLKGVINTYNINNYYEQGIDFILNNLVHEMLHHWSGALVFSNDQLETDSSLLQKDKVHWSNYVNFTSPLGGLGWQDNGDGMFSQTLSGHKIKLSDLDLYAMGLLPLRGIGEIFYLIPQDDLITHTISAEKVIVQPEQLAKAMGHWQCIINKE